MNKRYGVLEFDMTFLADPNIRYGKIDVNMVSYYISPCIYNKHGDLLVTTNPTDSKSDEVSLPCYWMSKDGAIKSADYNSGIFEQLMDQVDMYFDQMSEFSISYRLGSDFLKQFSEFKSVDFNITDADVFYDTKQAFMDYKNVAEQVPFDVTPDQITGMVVNNPANFDNSDNKPVLNKADAWEFLPIKIVDKKISVG